MNGAKGLFPRAEAACGRYVGLLAQVFAVLGGLVLLAVTVMTVLSITGRALTTLGLGPVPGDFELVEAGVAFAVFAFLPWCHFRRGHVTVDILVERFGPRGLAAFALLGNLLMTAAAALIAWRLGAGLQDRIAYGDTTFILQFPLSWPYAASLFGAWLFVLTAAYTVWRSLNELLGEGEGAGIRPSGTEWGE
ncbi:TRAP transporter small permease [Afifella pfennigii]|uniref:TRAP transporter small permease n=1 Tax=Afifella pfennigii TaxID=209897 RepID=UPI000A95A173|nr:TRAP transporter small permease [Afifella pfennigii]